jgi:hypothetical protein
MGERKMHTGCEWGNLREPLGRPRRRWDDTITIDRQGFDGAWTGLIWLRIETGGEHL